MHSPGSAHAASPHRQHDHARTIPDSLLDHLAGATDVGRLVDTHGQLYQR